MLQYLDRKILRITEAAAEHIVVRALGSNTDRADRHFKARVLAHLRSKVRQAAASAQTKRMADLNRFHSCMRATRVPQATALRFMRMLPEHNLYPLRMEAMGGTEVLIVGQISLTGLAHLRCGHAECVRQLWSTT